MRRKLKKFSRILSFLLFVVCIFTTVIFVIFDKSVAYQLELYAKQTAANKISSQINTVILEELQKFNITYDDIIRIEKTSEGRITAVQADMTTVNMLKNTLDIKVSELFEREEYYDVKIPVGNLFGKGILYGKGFDIKISFRPIGKVSTNITGDFHEAGINQTIYRISFDVITDAIIVFPFRYIEVPVKCDTVIAETIIVGDVPDSFTHFDLQGDITSQDFQGYVEDYMAE